MEDQIESYRVERTLLSAAFAFGIALMNGIRANRGRAALQRRARLTNRLWASALEIARLRYPQAHPVTSITASTTPIRVLYLDSGIRP